jgi:hypothetical protein
VSTGNKFASHCNNNTTGEACAIVSSAISQKDARKRGAPRAEFWTGRRAAASDKNLNTFPKLKSIGCREVIHHNIESDLPDQIKAPAEDDTEASAKRSINCPLSASNCDISRFSERGQRKAQRGNLPPGAGRVGRAWFGNHSVSGIEASTVTPKKEAPEIEHVLTVTKFQIAMGAATPLDHDAHRFPARQVDANLDGGLRRIRGYNWGILGTKIPGSIAARPGILSKRPPAKVCAAQRYRESSGAAIGHRKGPASECWTGPKDCGLRAAGAQVLADSRSAHRRLMTLCYKVFPDLAMEVTHG